MKHFQNNNERLKVLMVEHHSPGNRYVLELAREMKNECDLTIFCDMRNDLQEPGICWKRRFYNGGKGKAAAILDYGRTLVELEHEIRAGHYDVLHIQSFKKASAEMKLYEQMRKYYRLLVMTVHNVLPHEPAPGDAELYGRFYRACDLLIVHNDASKQDLKDKFNIPDEKIRVIPRGLYTTYSVDENARDNDERVHFLNFGRIRPYKGVDILLKAISLMDEKDRARCRFVIRGEQYPKLDPTDYAALIREYGIGDCVEFDNTRVPEEEIPKLIGNADFLLFPYRKIYGSGVLLMSYTYGVPVVASDVPTFVEGTDNGKAGILFASEDPVAMKDALLKAMDTTPEQREAYRAAIRKIVDERHNWKTTARSTVGAFREMLGGAPASERADLKAIEQLLTECAEANYDAFAQNGHADPGRNGPYGCTDTPVRNTAHWLITYAHLWKTTGEERYKTLALRFAQYLLGEQAKSRSGAVACVESGASDHLNGLIGQAWVIEALVYAYETFGGEEYLDCAVSIFRSQCFDEMTGFWKRVEPDGTELDYDYTLNHQVWFALSGLMLLRHREDEQIRRETKTHLKRLRKEYFGIHSSGLIRHFGAMKRPRRDFLNLYAKQYVKYAGLRLKVFKPRKVDILIQEEGYHLFELFGYAHIKALKPAYKLFDRKDFQKALAYDSDADTLNRRLGTDSPETMNKYAYGYNSPAFEAPFIDLMFSGSAAEEKVLSLLEKQKELCYNPETKSMERHNADPATLTARLYELVCYCDRCRG